MTPALNVQDVARLFNVPVSWVYAKVEDGSLPHFKLGRYVRFRASDIEAYLAANFREAKAS
jgi:excisionase family DNA binding protein